MPGRAGNRGSREGLRPALLLSLLILAGVGALASCGGDLESEAAAREPADLEARAPDPAPSGAAPQARSGGAGGTLWVLERSGPSVTVIDGETARVLQRIRLDFRSSPSDLLHWGGSVWVSDMRGALHRIDAETRRLVESIPVEAELHGLKAADHGIYGMDAESGIVTRHDPATGALLAELERTDRIHAMAAGPGVTAVLESDWARMHLFPAGSTQSRTVPSELASGDMVFGFGSFWLYQIDGKLLRIDPASGGVQAAIDTPEADNAFGIAIGREAVWVASLEEEAVLKVDPVSNRVVQRLQVAGAPEGVVELGGTLWVMLPQDDAVVRVNPASGEEEARVRVDRPSRIVAVP
jgi:streptogramin lyase